jgi:hypothetical protein
MRYKWQHVKPDDNGEIEVDGRITDVRHISNDPKRGVFVLVEIEDGRSVPHQFTDDAEGVSAQEDMDRDVEENADLYDALADKPTCAGKGGQCSRTVSEPGETCWQHEDE